MVKTKNSLLYRLILPIFFLFLFGGGSIVYYVYYVNEERTLESALTYAVNTVNQIKMIRGYYSSNVVSKIKKQGSFEITVDHKQNDNAIPLPATFVHDISALSQKKNSGMSFKLYSSYPFKNRVNRKLDDFAQSALKEVTANKNKPYYRLMDYNGEETLRVAIQDSLSKQSCVNCHNSHPLSPKTDWKLGDFRGILEINIPLKKQLEANSHITTSMIFFLIIALIFLLISIWFLYKKNIVEPIKNLVSIGDAISNKDLTKKIDNTRHDEIGQLYDNFSLITLSLNQIISKIKLLIKNSNTVSDKLVKDARSSNESIDDINKNVDQINGMAHELYNDIQQCQEETSKVRNFIQDVSNLINTQVNAVMDSSGSISQISNSIKHISESSAHSLQLVNELEKEAISGEKGMKETSTLIKNVSESANIIMDMINVINGIAEQTNLLAMNAAIEAAHAGSAGKGFAVVADEIRKLAEDTSKYSKEISTSLKEISDYIIDSDNATSKTGESFQHIVTGVKDVVTAMNDIINFMNELNNSSQVILGSLNSLVEITDEVKSSSGEMNQRVENISISLNKVASSSIEVKNNTNKVSETVKELEKLSDNVEIAGDENKKSVNELVELSEKFKTKKEISDLGLKDSE